MLAEHFVGCDPPVEELHRTLTHDLGCPHFIRSAKTKPFVWQSVHQQHSADPSAIFQHMARTNRGRNGHSASPTVPSLKRAHILSSAEESARHEREKDKGKKKKIQYNTTSRGASRRTAWAPGLSCLYKQALIFLSSPGTSAIYSQLCGRGPGGAREILLQSSWALEACVWE